MQGLEIFVDWSFDLIGNIKLQTRQLQSQVTVSKKVTILMTVQVEHYNCQNGNIDSDSAMIT